MITDKTIVEIYEPGRSYSAGPNNLRKPSKKEIDDFGGIYSNNYICFEMFGCVVLQKDLPYKNIWFWHEKGHALYNEIHGPTNKRSLKVEKFCDQYMLFVCGWKRTIKAMFRTMSDDMDSTGQNELIQRIIAISENHPLRFIISDELIKVSEKLKRLKKPRSKSRRILLCWRNNLFKLCKAIDMEYLVEHTKEYRKD